MIKFQTDRMAFQNALAVATKAVSNRTTMPILECVMIDARDGRITLTGNDLEKGIETSVAADITEEGVIAVNGKMFNDIVRKMPGDSFSFDADEKYTVKIKSGKAKFAIAGQSAEEFPRLQSVTAYFAISVQQRVLKNMIQRTIFASEANGSNKMMSGVLIENDRFNLRMVALDGHRIAIRTTELDTEYPSMKSVVPVETLSEIAKILYDEDDEMVRIAFAKNHITFESDEIRAISRLIDGEYFDINKILTDEYKLKASFSKSELVQSLERSMLFLKENAKRPIIFSFADTEVHLSIETTAGSFAETISVDKTGDDIEIGFNPKFLLDALKAIEDDTVTMYMMGQRNPCFICNEEGTYCYVVLPVNFTK